MLLRRDLPLLKEQAIRLWDARKRKELGAMKICNVGGTVSRGAYFAALAANTGRLRTGRHWRTTGFQDFPRRSLGAYDLLFRALLWAVGDRNKKEIARWLKSKCVTESSTP